MRACTKTLIDTLAGENIDDIAEDLYSNNLISQDVYEELSLPTKTKKQKARDVVNNVAGKVNANQANFIKFIGVLVDNEQSHLAKKLEDKFGEFSYYLRSNCFTILFLDLFHDTV